MLKRFSVDTHPNLITLLATWKHGDDYFLLFPWAPYDLLGYWERHRNPSVCFGEVYCASKQLLGIVDALRQIHNYQGSIPVDGREGVNYGRHGDIKAENILVFHDPTSATSDDEPLSRRMVLADLNLGRFNSDGSKSTVPNHMWTGTPNLRTPECDIEGRTISRSWDIWALGIFYLDYAIWLLLGYDALEQFTNDRRSSYPLLGRKVYMRLYFDVRILGGMTVIVIKKVVTEVSSTCVLLNLSRQASYPTPAALELPLVPADPLPIDQIPTPCIPADTDTTSDVRQTSFPREMLPLYPRPARFNTRSLVDRRN